jgi:hypothetical protein
MLVLAGPPPRRQARRSCAAFVLPHHSTRLAKKAGRRMPAVAAAQNVIMWKLGLASNEHIETEDFSAYINLFRDGLSEDQARMIDELFMDKPPSPLDDVTEEAD